MAQLIRYLLTLFLIGCAINVYGQRYKGSEIIRKADSALISVVGKRIFDGYYYLEPRGTYYSYKNFGGNTDFEKLRINKKTKGKLIEAGVRYAFCIMQAGYSFSTANVEFDKNLKTKVFIDTNTIPKYILDNAPNNFITDSVALSIAKKFFRQKGIKPLIVNLIYDLDRKTHVWKIHNVTEEHPHPIVQDPVGKMETVKVDAITGKVVDYDPQDGYGVVL